MEEKNQIKISLKTSIIIACIIAIFIIGIIAIIKYCIENNKTEMSVPIPNELTTDIIYKNNDGFSVYTYDNKEYLVLSNGYNGEHDIEYFEISPKDSKKIEEFSLYSYEEYKSFCKKYDINQKYEDKDKHYIVYYYTDSPANSISAKLGGVEYDNDKVSLYIWDRVSYNGGVLLADANQKAYVIIIPTDRTIKNYQIIPLMHKVEYNRMVGNNPLYGYSFDKWDNKNIAKNNYINSKNTLLNNIINNSLDAIANQHTIKIDTYIEDTDIKLVSYMDLINSVFKIQAGTKALHYTAYASDMKIIYSKYDSDYDNTYSYQDIIVDRNYILYDVFSQFGNDFIENIDNYEINIQEDSQNYIIDVRSSNTYLDTTYYINKQTYLIDKVIKDRRTNEFSYTEDNILLPNDIDVGTIQATVDKPIIYLYPTEETETSVKLLNDERITCSYPKYIDEWNVLAKPNGDLIDLDTGRQLYSLYYESESIERFNVSKEGFVVKGEDSAKFLEEKLAVLGLTEREAEEFIIYWLPKLESNKYNYIRFATDEEINNNMPLEINPNPDTIIRVLMTFKGLENPIEIEEQKLEMFERKGFTVVEWGGTEIK